ncbi:MAG: hypothetical protein ACI8W8_001673 [Rhodothermales bacterium]|jgi:hypothetical protein
MKRPFVTLLTALTFAVLAVTGVLAFLRAFSLQIVGLHALMGFVFIGLVGFHVFNNIRPLKSHLRSKVLWLTLAISATLSVVIWQQPRPVKALLGFSANIGPALDRFELSEDGLSYQYSPAPSYKMALSVKTAKGYDIANPPDIAIWLENQGAFHIKSLHTPEPGREAELPYWHFKRRGWEQAKRDAESAREEVDAVSEATPNGSFDPADYILPADPDNPMPYSLLIEINQPGDEQPSLVYSVEIDNLWPTTYQVLEIVGYPKQEDDEDGKEAWSLYYVDDSISSALGLIDSALLTIDRSAAD